MSGGETKPETIRVDTELKNFDAARRPITGSRRVAGRTPYLGASGTVDYVEGFTHKGDFICVSEDGENLRSRSAPIAWVQRGEFWANNHLHVLGGLPLPRLRFYAAAIEQANIGAYLTGSAQPKLSQESLNTVLLPRFNSSAQTAIGEVLGALDDKIAANERLSAISLRLGELHLRGCPLETQALGDASDVTMGTSPRGEKLHDTPVGLPFYQGARDFRDLSPTHRIYTADPVRTTPASSTLLSVRAPVGRINFVTQESAIGRGVAGVFSSERPASLFFALRAFQHVWSEFDGGGTVFSSVTAAQVRSMPLPLPDRDSATAIEGVLGSLLKRSLTAETESQVLASTRDELLPLLMSGKITVRDAEAQAEEVL